MGIRLNCVVEGQTEETFVNLVLKPYLSGRGVWANARCVRTRRTQTAVYRGGLGNYAVPKRDISSWLREDQNADVIFTTMFDLYALPTDFPGYGSARRIIDPLLRVAALESALASDVNDPRFIPYIQLHEFEALVLADPVKLDGEFPNHAGPIANLTKMAGKFLSPEHVDDGSETSPSNRIINEIPEYKGRKASSGPLVVQRIGLPLLSQKCKHFGEWLARLEALGT